MSEYKEKISAFLDDAAQPAELAALVQEQNSDSASLGVAARYQIIGEALRGEVTDAAFVDVSSQVGQALANDVRDPVSPVVSQIKRPLLDLSSWGRLLYGPPGGFAVAASVALVMVFAVTQENLDQNSGQNPDQMNGAQVASQPSVQPMVVSTPVAVAIENSAGDLPRNRSGIDLETYLAEHAEFAAQDTMMGRLPYVRAVSYEAK